MDDLERFHDGDRDLFRALVVEHGPDVLRVARAYTDDESAAEDLFQEVWLKVWTRRLQYSGRGSFRSWLLAIVRNERVSRYRKQRGYRNAIETVGRTAITTGESSTPADGPRIVEQRELRLRLVEALGHLPNRQRLAVEMRLLEALDEREAAEQMCCAPATVRSLLRNGLGRLRVVLNATEEES